MGALKRCGFTVIATGLVFLRPVSEEASLIAETLVPATTVCAVYDGKVANPYAVVSFFMLPGETISLSMLGDHAGSTHDLEVEAVKVGGVGNAFKWVAPSLPGLYTGFIRHSHSSEPTRVNFFVMTPMRQMRNNALNGYSIGSYPMPMAGRESLYGTPDGFVQVTRENEETLVSPHFTLRQFLCKQEAGYPKYVVLEERLLVALETILERVRQEGFPASTLFVMSGYRTPVYNRSIGNVPNSRHVFGDAADIFIDQSPVDGIMDDLNRDGRSDRADNEILARIVEESLRSYNGTFRTVSGFVGGIGKYPRNASHGPFVHVDLRGYRARW